MFGFWIIKIKELDHALSQVIDQEMTIGAFRQQLACLDDKEILSQAQIECLYSDNREFVMMRTLNDGS